MSDTHWRTLRIATYNIHRCRGLDGRTNPSRVADVIRAIEPDVIALQEVIGAGPQSPGHAEQLGAQLGMGWVMAPTRHLRGTLFGNVVLSRHPIIHHAQYDLSWKTCEPRCCQRVDIAFGDDSRIAQPKVVLGDFNEWMRGLATTLLTERLQSIDLRSHLRRRRTYPGVFPVLHLDHIYYDGRVEVVKLDLPRTRQALMASDHLPLVAELKIQFR
jgi:endonuclease/exonuclease/phosphatase family metal-dependent hydrolase